MKKTKKNTVVVVRTYSAGVHVGRLVRHRGKEVELADAHRIWRWRGANTLHELALHGAAQEWTRISERVGSIMLTEAIEIIPCTDRAADDLRTPRWA